MNMHDLFQELGKFVGDPGVQITIGMTIMAVFFMFITSFTIEFPKPKTAQKAKKISL